MSPEAADRGPLATWYRTHTCGELRKEHAGRSVKLSGAIDRYVDDATVELRDAYGKTLVRLSPEAKKQLVELTPEDLRKGGKAPLETIILVEGKVEARRAPDPKSPTGEVQVAGGGVRVLSAGKEPLVIDFKNDALPAHERIRHRYVWLRNEKAQENFRFRTKVLAEVRRHLREKGFLEVETPLLANRWTPEARDCFLAIRERNKIFALPGSRTVHGSLLMAGGLDRTFEIARRFKRQAAYGPFEQPEYHIVDMTMAFVDEPDLFRPVDRLLAHVWKAVLGEELKLPVPELTLDDALLRYGSASPDVRFPVEVQDVTALAAAARTSEGKEMLPAGGAARALRVPKAAETLKEGELRKLSEILSREKNAAVGWIFPGVGGNTGKIFATGELMVPIPGFGRLVRTWPTGLYEVAEGALDDAFAKRVASAVGARPGDVAIFTLGKDKPTASELAGTARAEVAKIVGPPPGAPKWGLVRITRLPYFRFDAKESAWDITGDPLTRPVEEELEGDPHQLHGYGHHLVLNGVTIGSGALRNHNPDVQLKLLKALGMESDEVDRRFGSILQAFRFGVPPHGRAGIGLDRLVALLRGLERIDEVIPLPKDETGVDPLARTPAPIKPSVVRGYFGL